MKGRREKMTVKLMTNQRPGMCRRFPVRAAAQSQRGASLVELIVMVPFLMLLLLGVIDFGRGFYFSIEVVNAARAGAQYGSQNTVTMLDNAGMKTAAKNEAPDISTACTGNPGTTCWAGTFPQATSASELASGGSAHTVNYVKVTTKATYTPMINWPGLGFPALNSKVILRVESQ